MRRISSAAAGEPLRLLRVAVLRARVVQDLDVGVHRLIDDLVGHVRRVRKVPKQRQHLQFKRSFFVVTLSKVRTSEFAFVSIEFFLSFLLIPVVRTLLFHKVCNLNIIDFSPLAHFNKWF